jgi:hypothetical protein
MNCMVDDRDCPLSAGWGVALCCCPNAEVEEIPKATIPASHILIFTFPSWRNVDAHALYRWIEAGNPILQQRREAAENDDGGGDDEQHGERDGMRFDG